MAQRIFYKKTDGFIIVLMPNNQGHVYQEFDPATEDFIDDDTVVSDVVTKRVDTILKIVRDATSQEQIDTKGPQGRAFAKALFTQLNGANNNQRLDRWIALTHVNDYGGLFGIWFVFVESRDVLAAGDLLLVQKVWTVVAAQVGTADEVFDATEEGKLRTEAALHGIILS